MAKVTTAQLAEQVAALTNAVGAITDALGATNADAETPADRKAETSAKARRTMPAGVVRQSLITDAAGKPVALVAREASYRNSVSFYDVDSDGNVRTRGERSSRPGEPRKPHRVPEAQLRAFLEANAKTRSAILEHWAA